MAKKRKSKRLDQFLRRRKRSKEAELLRKTRQANRMFRMLVGGVLVAALLFLVKLPEGASRLGLGVVFGLVTGLGVAMVNRVEPHLFRRTARFNQLVLLVVGVVLVAHLTMKLGWSPYLLPLPILGMVVGIAYSPTVAIVLGMALAFYLSLLTQSGEGAYVVLAGEGAHFPAIDLQLAMVLSLGVVTSVLGMGRVRSQSRPVVVGFYVGVVHAASIVGFQLLSGRFGMDGRFVDGSWRPEMAAALSETREFFEAPGYGFAGGLICGSIVTSLLPAIERFFGVVTERRLLELADPSNNLLRVLRERAPGTFQHTLGVQQLAREATEAIGGDSLLADVGAYYHDIGKIYKPEYFVENMGEDKTIHDRLRPSMSKLIIISHVKDGILLANEEKLPQKIVDMIPMHHGTTVVEFFYRKALRESGDVEEQAPAEDVEYRYPGPKPTFREAGVLMLADAVEAISKTMEEPTTNQFRDMVRSVIRKRLFDGQLDECQLTVADLHRIEDSFVRTLGNMYHGRVKYPSAGDSEETNGSVPVAGTLGSRSDAGGDEKQPGGLDGPGDAPSAKKLGVS